MLVFQSFGGDAIKSCRYSEEQRQIFSLVYYATQELYQTTQRKNISPYLYWWEISKDDDSDDQIHRHRLQDMNGMFEEATRILNSGSNITAYAIAWEDTRIIDKSKLSILKIAAGFRNQNGYEVYYDLSDFLNSAMVELGCSVNLLNKKIVS